MCGGIALPLCCAVWPIQVKAGKAAIPAYHRTFHGLLSIFIDEKFEICVATRRRIRMKTPNVVGLTGGVPVLKREVP